MASVFKLVRSDFPKNKGERKNKFIQLHQETQKYLNDIGTLYVSLADKTIEGWKRPPGFEYKISFPGKGNLRLTVRLTGTKLNKNKWLWMDAGTASRTIVPRKSSYLRYRRDYKASTSKGVIGSGANAKSGPWVTRTSVSNHSIEARHLNDAIQGQVAPHVKQLTDRLTKHVA